MQCLSRHDKLLNFRVRNKKVNNVKNVIFQIIQNLHFFIFTLVDENGDLPLSIAFKTSCSSYARNYPVIEILMKSMTKKLNESNMSPIVFDSEKNTMFSHFAKNVSFAYIDQEKDVFNKLVKLFKTVDEKKLLVEPFETYIEAKKGPYSAFIELCFAYARFAKLDQSFSEEIGFYSFLGKPFYFRDDKNEDEDEWKIARNIIKNFITELKPKFFYQIEINDEKTRKSKLLNISAALAILGSEHSNEPKPKNEELRPGFKLLLNYTQEIDCQDSNGLTQLYKASQRNHTEQALNLIQAGADLNFVHESKNEKEIKLKDDTKLRIKPRLTALMHAIDNGNLKLVRALLKHGAKLRPINSEIKLPDGAILQIQPLLNAVLECKHDRSNQARLDILKELICFGKILPKHLLVC